MSKAKFSLITAMLLALSLSAACAEQVSGEEETVKATASTEQAPETTEQGAGDGEAENEATGGDSIMDQPVDFSSPEKVEESLQKIREAEGDTAYMQVKNAMDFVLFYDISLTRNKAKLYEKLDGKTPNQIKAMVTR
ncbi:MAG: hypothetical protein PVF46_02205 [Lysobacterales bacterium]